MISPDIDREKVRILLSHLIKARKKVEGKMESRRKLEEQMQKLKKSTRAKAARREIKELEKRLADVLEKEEEILRHQKTREISQGRIRDKIHELEAKLSKYIELRMRREKRIAELEEKVKKRFSAEKRQVDLLEDQLVHLENLFERISSDKKYTKSQIKSVKKKVDSLKKRLAKVK